ncbi:MAG: hypothetical protein QXN55_00920 [Candidatus Nitrosotenuis sp.]
MLFTLLVFLSALTIEIIGSIISILGWSSFFSNNFLVLAVAASLDLGKVVGVSFLYKEWHSIGFLQKLYGVPATVALILITSAGAAGFLAAEFQKSSIPTKGIEAKVELLEAEKVKLEARKKEIDAQIANLPADVVKGRAKLIANFKAEQETVTTRVAEIDKELPELKVTQIDRNAHVGPIMYLAALFGKTPEETVSYAIGLIIFVFDPLAIWLLLSGNYLLDKKLPKKEIIITPEEVIVDLTPEPLQPGFTKIQSGPLELDSSFKPKIEETIEAIPELEVNDKTPTVLEEIEEPPAISTLSSIDANSTQINFGKTAKTSPVTQAYK